MPKKKIALILITLAVIINLFIVFRSKSPDVLVYNINFLMTSDKPMTVQAFYSETTTFIEEASTKADYITSGEASSIRFSMPSSTKFLRLDFGEAKSSLNISGFEAVYKSKKAPIDINIIAQPYVANLINMITSNDKSVYIETRDVDPYIVLDMTEGKWNDAFAVYENIFLNFKRIILCVVIDFLLLLLFIKAKRLLIVPMEIYRNRKLILYLAKNDFKTKFAGSYFGIFWAFVQPVITILLYWFVFQVGFRSSSMNEFPFVLWLIAGLVPWFFYSEALSTATNCFLEYSYLVKKVVFTVSILPVVKTIAAFFVHIFFIGFALIMYIAYGYMPTIYMIQILYYTICMLALILSVSYITSSIIPFFRDLGQIINIFLQISMWMTPIMWNYTMIPQKFIWLFKINPMYYIIEGYRDSFINNIWFFDKIDYTIYFWLLIGILFIIGTTIFKRLRPHFADVI